MKNLKNDRGIAMLAVIGMVLILSIITVGVFTLASQTTKSSTQRRQKDNSLYMAESGVNYLLYELKKQNKPPEQYEFPYTIDSSILDEGYLEPGDSFSVVFDQDDEIGTDNVYIAVSTGVSKNSTRVINVNVDYIAPTIVAYDYTLFSGSPSNLLIINGNGNDILGSSHTNGNFRVNGNNNSITGAVEAVGTITINGNNNVIPNRYPQSSSVDMPDYMEEVIQQAESAGEVFYTSKTYNSNNINVDNSIYITGNATLNGNRIFGAGAILTTGNITLNGNNLNATTNDQVCLYAGQNITINGNGATIEGILYAPNGTITLNGNNITVNGRVIGNNVTFSGNNITVNGTDSEVISIPGNDTQDGIWQVREWTD